MFSAGAGSLGRAYRPKNGPGPDLRTKRVKHYDDPRHVHELTFSCYRRVPRRTNDDWLPLAASYRSPPVAPKECKGGASLSAIATPPRSAGFGSAGASPSRGPETLFITRHNPRVPRQARGVRVAPIFPWQLPHRRGHVPTSTGL